MWFSDIYVILSDENIKTTYYSFTHEIGIEDIP